MKTSIDLVLIEVDLLITDNVPGESNFSLL